MNQFLEELKKRRISFLFLLMALALLLCGCTASMGYGSFDPDADGLVRVQTVHGSNHDMKCFALACLFASTVPAMIPRMNGQFCGSPGSMVK